MTEDWHRWEQEKGISMLLAAGFDAVSQVKQLEENLK